VTGLLLCALGLYAALAMALEDAKRNTLLPMLRVGTARDALEGDFREQLVRIEHEAGVREQL
jgi:hypothetical protein